MEKGIDVPTRELNIPAKEHLTDEIEALNPVQTLPILVLDDGTAGAQFENGNSDDLARVANRMLADSDYRQSLAEKGLKRASLYDWGRVTKEIVDVYHSVRVPGDKVTEDLRGQFGGRFAHRDGWRGNSDRVTEAVPSGERSSRGGSAEDDS